MLHTWATLPQTPQMCRAVTHRTPPSAGVRRTLRNMTNQDDTTEKRIGRQITITGPNETGPSPHIKCECGARYHGVDAARGCCGERNA